MGWAKAAAIAVGVMLMIGLILYSVEQFQARIAKLRGVEAPKRRSFQIPWNLIQNGVMMSIALAAPLIALRIYWDRTRLFGVIRVEDFQRHLLLFGPTGSGKTSTALKAVERGLRRGIPAEILDWKGEYATKFRGATVIRKVKLLEPPDWGNVQSHVLVVIDILRDVLDLSEPMSYMLYEELTKMYEQRSASFTTLLEQLKYRRATALAQRFRAEANIAEALIRRILPLVLDEARDAENLRGSDKVVIYDLSQLPTYQLKTLYAEIILWRLYNEALKAGSGSLSLKKLIIAEESQNYVRPRRAERQPSIGERMVNELRSYGYGFILIAPDPSQLPYHMARDAGAVISIGYQGLPGVVAELLSYYRYADIKKLLKTTSKPRTYVYYNGRLYIKGVPKPYKSAIDLGVQAVPERAATEEVEERPVEKPLVLEEEEPEPIGGADHPSNSLTPGGGSRDMGRIGEGRL